MIITGAPLTELDPIRSWSRRNGWQITYRSLGTQAEVEARAIVHKAAGASIEIEPPGEGAAEWMVKGTYGADPDTSPDEPIFDDWELDGNTLEKSVWEMPSVAAEFEKIRDDVGGGVTRAQASAFLRRLITAFIRGDDEIKGMSGNEFELTYEFVLESLETIGLARAPFDDLIYLLSKGHETFPLPQFVLRRTRKYPDGTNFKGDYALVFKALTLSTLRTQEEIPETLLFNLPEGGIWVKQTPTMKRSSSTQWTFTEEWWHADFAEPRIYGAPL